MAAYQGAGWKDRTGSLADDLSGRRGIWAPWRVGSEFGRLEAVLLYCPGPEMRAVRSPNAIQHAGRIDPSAVRREYARIASVFGRLGAKVLFIPRAFADRPWPKKHNLMFVRDLFFNTKEGAVVSRMASAVRAGEEKYVSLALAAAGVPILHTMSGRALFEAADALWLDSRTVVCGVGGRTNGEGFRQLSDVLRRQNVRTIAVPVPRGIQHLLGILQIVDARRALVRAEMAPARLVSLLKARGFSLLRVPETEETIDRQGMNVVTVAPGKIVMPDDCPDLKRRYIAGGLIIAAEVDIRQIRRGAGGLACATGILSRRGRT
jgi:N-dimethylarginine dimethylaminohydrolase